MDDSFYDVAQICLNGHVVTSMAGSHPVRCQPFCDKCGESTITACSECQAAIRGYLFVPGVIGGSYEIPSFCFNCGAAFPWTVGRKQAAIDLFIEECQDANDQRVFSESIEQITRDTPQAQVAATRLNKMLDKIRPATAGIIRDIIVDVASGAAQNILLS